MSLLQQVQTAPTQGCALPLPAFVRYREKPATAAQAGTVVLLHGIGSGSGSWHRVLSSALPQRLLAWDAPGYADSNPLSAEQPSAQDYGRVLWAWLNELGETQPVHLVGHSLGCLMAAGAAALQAPRVASLSLLAPAQGYGSAEPAVREKKTQERLQAMRDLGLAAMAAQRAPRLLSPAAHAEDVELATFMMSQLNPGGYTQATHMLGQGHIRADLRAAFAQSPSLHAATRVACGALDVITPPAACEKLARELQLPYVDLGPVGHLCALEGSAAVVAVLQSWLSPMHEGGNDVQRRP